MRTEGSIEQKGLPEVLLRLGIERSTGILTIQGRDEIIAFAFLKGGIVSADALNQALEDGLGRVLTQIGVISEGEFAGLAAEYQSGGGQVVDLLVERGFVQRAELLDAVRAHTYQLCRQALAWTEGDYKFYQGEEVSYEEGVRPLSPEELLVRASRELDLELLPGGVAPSDAIYRRSESSAQSEDREGAEGLEGLDPAALAAFKLIDGRRSVADLAIESGAAEFRVAYLLNRWQRAGLVERSKRRSVPPPAATPTPGPATAGRSAAPSPERRPPRRRWWGAGRAAKGKPQPEALPWPSRILGLAFVALFSASFLAAPNRVLLPLPWQGGLQEALERERAAAALSRLRRANSAYFLLEGRFAEELPDLARAGLLPEADLADVTGRPLAYSATTASYVVRSSLGEGSEQETFLQETIRGNFLLDPELEQPAQSRRPPLVLLD